MVDMRGTSAARGTKGGPSWRREVALDIRLPLHVAWEPVLPYRIRVASPEEGILLFEGTRYQDAERGDLLWERPTFWKDVRQVFFHAIARNTRQLVEDYEQFGLLAPQYTNHLAGGHDAERCILMLDADLEDWAEELEDIQKVYDKQGWGAFPYNVDEIFLSRAEDVQTAFADWVSATKWLDWIRKNRLGAIGEYMEWDGASPHQQFIVRRSDDYDFMQDGEWFEVPGGHSWRQFCEAHSERDGDDLNGPDATDSTMTVCGRVPRNRAEQLLGAWARLNDEMSGIWETFGSLIDISQGTPAIFCDGALDAAIMQWLFQEFTAASGRSCARSGCTNSVGGSQRRYCSPRCADTQKKRDYRRRHADKPRRLV